MGTVTWLCASRRGPLTLGVHSMGRTGHNVWMPPLLRGCAAWHALPRCTVCDLWGLPLMPHYSGVCSDQSEEWESNVASQVF